MNMVINKWKQIITVNTFLNRKSHDRVRWWKWRRSETQSKQGKSFSLFVEISMELLALNFRCQCTQQKLQPICAVSTFYPQLKKILTFSVKDRKSSALPFRRQPKHYGCFESCQFRPHSVIFVSWRLKGKADDFRSFTENVIVIWGGVDFGPYSSQSLLLQVRKVKNWIVLICVSL
jgi:hypothetical protein